MSGLEKLLFSKKQFLLWDAKYDNIPSQLKTLAGIYVITGKLEGRKKPEKAC